MTELDFKKAGLLAIHDTGVPQTAQGSNYTTLFLIHGFAWHGGMAVTGFFLYSKCLLISIVYRHLLASDTFYSTK
jgi:hypothetical protein